FFDLGGDSILSIQVVSRARAAGLTVSPKDVFDCQTVAILAERVADASQEDTADERPAVHGPVGPTPVQEWFFRTHTAAPHHFGMSMAATLPAHVDRTALATAMTALVERHDALRMCFGRTEDGTWIQSAAAPTDSAPLHHDLSGLPPEQRTAELDRTVRTAQAGMDLASGPLFQALTFDLGADGTRLVMVAHHLVVDGVSWRVLLEDLEVAYGQVVSGVPVDLGVGSSSFGE
ncbi:hypothetical protein FKN01_32275, partial [Streptomyces sp. 130]|uniref:condensation domain-containing protein n=1 Tax=Streptomyces sp. 130 TaxID=2591006 RepID=UPI00117EEF4A